MAGRSPALEPAPQGETADEWWERVRREHGPMPADHPLRALYSGVRARASERAAAAASPVGSAS